MKYISKNIHFLRTLTIHWFKINIQQCRMLYLSHFLKTRVCYIYSSISISIIYLDWWHFHCHTNISVVSNMIQRIEYVTLCSLCSVQSDVSRPFNDFDDETTHSADIDFIEFSAFNQILVFIFIDRIVWIMAFQ